MVKRLPESKVFRQPYFIYTQFSQVLTAIHKRLTTQALEALVLEYCAKPNFVVQANGAGFGQQALQALRVVARMAAVAAELAGVVLQGNSRLRAGR